MKIDDGVQRVLEETQKRIDIVRQMYENDVTLSYKDQPMSKLRDIMMDLKRVYYHTYTEHRPVRYLVCQYTNTGEISPITDLIEFLQKHMVCYDGVPLHTKITEHCKFKHRNSDVRKAEWEKHPMYGSFFFSREAERQYRATWEGVEVYRTDAFNYWEIAKCDFTNEEYELVMNMCMLTQRKLVDVLTSLMRYDLIPPIEEQDVQKVDVGYDYTFAKRVHKWNGQTTIAGSYKHIHEHKDKIVQIGVDYLTELWNNRLNDVSIPCIMKYFNAVPLLMNYDQYTVDSNDMHNFLTSTKRLDTYDELIACNKFVNEVASEILERIKPLGILDR